MKNSPMEDPSTNTPTLTKLIKTLASCDAKTRSQSIKALITLLPTLTQTQISDTQMKKLWKSLFYCMWHSDKIQNQTHLINRLSSLLLTLPPLLSLSYFTHFVVTMKREWPGIDHLRLDKFYLLVRFFVRNLFCLMRENKWGLGILEGYVSVLEKRLFFDEEKERVVGNGVGYHVVSVFCEELLPFLPLGKDVVEVLFRPFLGILSKSDNKVLVGKVKGSVFECLVKNGKELVRVRKMGGGVVDEKGEVFLLGCVGLGLGFGRKLFELGSGTECVQGNRKVVFGLHEEFVKLEKEMAAVGFEVSFPDGGGDSVEMDVDLVSNGNGEVKKPNEKKSKEKKSKDKKSKDEKLKEKKLEEKKSKKKKKKSKDVSNEGLEASDGDVDAEMLREDDGEDEVQLNEVVLSNLQQQFEKIAAESGLDGDGVSALESPQTAEANGKAVKKRKRSKVSGSAQKGWVERANEGGEEDDAPKTEGKSAKRVRFSMKNNIVWKPTTPLPPQSVRIPPSSTPRGSALKKGWSPGPIIDPSQQVKRAKKASPLRRAKKAKSVTPRVKRVKRKAKPMSA